MFRVRSAHVTAAGKTVVIADDTAFVRDRFRIALQAAGHHVDAVGSAPELLARVRREGPIDLVVLDLQLPQAQGVGLVKTLRQVEGFLAPIVIFSGTIAHADEVRQLAALGVSDYINEYSKVQYIPQALAPHVNQDCKNRRASPRVSLGVAVTYRIGNSIVSAVTLNVSTGGLAVRATNPPELGTLIRVRFKVPGAPEVDAEATVVWSDRRTGLGLHFTRIGTRDQQSIEQFVRAGFFSNRKA
jgi:two-component system chemotaxis response regulator CheY